jgi:regulator of CtrA degradation
MSDPSHNTHLKGVGKECAMRRGKAAMQAPTAFFNKTYDEAMALLVEARDFIARGQDMGPEFTETSCRARMVVETSRLTARLTHVMAWLLARKAVHAGELTPDQATQPPYVLERDEMLVSNDSPFGDDLPPSLESLIDRSRHLYIRVSRLDELVRRGANA